MRLCVVGTGRCGTTLLWRMLNVHPDLFVFRETHWLPALWERYGTTEASTEAMMEIVARTRFVDGTTVTPIDPDWLRAQPGHAPRMTLRAFADLLGSAHAEREEKRFWADKTPDYGYFMGVLQVLWPDLRFVHVIRNGMDAAKSMSLHKGYRALAHHRQLHWAPLSLDYEPVAEQLPRPDWLAQADLWHDRLLRIRDEAQRLSPGTYMEVRHEQLRHCPGEALTRIAAFGGLAAGQDWIARAESLIDLSRGKYTHSDEDYARLLPRHRALLRELGYRESPVSP